MATVAESRDIDAEAVMRGESLELEAVRLAVGAGLAAVFGKEIELAVGENTIDVEEKDFNAAGAVFRG